MTMALQTQVAEGYRGNRASDIRAQRPGLLWLGNHLSKTKSGTAASEDVIGRLRARGWRVASSSAQQNQILRLAEMVGTAVKKRAQYSEAIIDVFSGNAFLYAEVLARLLSRLGKPVILVLHGGALLEFRVKHPERVRRLLAQARLVVSPSQYLARGFSFLRPDIVHIPNGLNLEQYKFKQRTQTRPSLCWLRAMHKTYNPVMAVECLARLLPEFPGAHLRMVGPNKHDGALELTRARARDLGVQDALTVTGPVPRALVPHTLQQDDVFLNTTNYDSFGVSALEAAASGLCVVATAVGENRHLWRDGDDALLVRANDSEAMATATRRILLSRETAARLSSNGRSNAERFDWSVVTPQWEELLMGNN
jgi:glycosyltransferase involved in cell wall biosynthesis